MKQLLVVFSLAVLSVTTAFSQLNLIQFESTEHDFGVRKEEEEKLDHTFKLKNISDGPIKLTYVKAACGCTTPTWTQDVIPAKGEAFVSASYGAKHRPGKFDKTVTVRATKVDAKGEVKDSSLSDTKILRIKGDVTPRVKGIKDWYPNEEGSLRYSANHITFGEIKKSEVKTKQLTFFNQGKKPITVKQVDYQNPNQQHLKFEFKQGMTVKPNDSIHVDVTYDANKATDWEFVHERVNLQTDDDSVAKKTIYISATIKPDFSSMSEADKANAPRIEFEKTVHDFGVINQGDVAKTEFVFKNTGKSTLKILKTKASCGCTAPDLKDTELKPGDSSKIDVSFNSAGKSGPTTKQVTVVTNDPANPIIKLDIKSDIKVKEGKDAHGHDHSDPNHKH